MFAKYFDIKLERYNKNQLIKGVGRLIYKQNKGGISFWIIRHKEDDVKLLLENSKIENYNKIKKTNKGSLVKFKGYISKTLNQKETIIRIEKLEVPVNYKGNLYTKSQNVGKNRLIDILNDGYKFKYYKYISEIPFYIRKNLIKKEFREFNTNILHSDFNAGLATPYKTKNIFSKKIFNLTFTSETRLASLVFSGYDNVYEINQSFRNGGSDWKHAIEFSMLEICSTTYNYKKLSIILEKILRGCFGTYIKEFDQINSDIVKRISSYIKQPFEWVTLQNAFKKYLNINKEDINLEYLSKNYPKKFSLSDPLPTWTGKLVNLITPKITLPTFIYNIPPGLSPLIRNSKNKHFSEKVTLVINGISIADVHNGENDYKNLKNELIFQKKITGKKINKAYLELTKMGIPRFSSMGLFLNRFYMLFLDTNNFNIKETFIFSNE